jgi:hypothetical protein
VATETVEERRHRLTVEFRLRVARLIVARGPKDHRYADALRDLERLTGEGAAK